MQNKEPVYILKQLKVSPELCDEKYTYALNKITSLPPLPYNVIFVSI